MDPQILDGLAPWESPGEQFKYAALLRPAHPQRLWLTTPRGIFLQPSLGARAGNRWVPKGHCLGVFPSTREHRVRMSPSLGYQSSEHRAVHRAWGEVTESHQAGLSTQSIHPSLLPSPCLPPQMPTLRSPFAQEAPAPKADAGSPTFIHTGSAQPRSWSGRQWQGLLHGRCMSPERLCVQSTQT